MLFKFYFGWRNYENKRKSKSFLILLAQLKASSNVRQPQAFRMLYSSDKSIAVIPCLIAISKVR